MIQLTPDEARVLGVLIEKAMTTPEQYPLSQNAVTNGANQKSNRHPVMSMDENRVFDALEGLRAKGLVVRVDQAGSRVNKYRHQGGEALSARPAELALLAEMLLRGPQTLGELRGRASRMQAFESLDAVKNMLGALRERGEPMVRQLPPAPGSRAERYAQLLCPQDAADAQEGGASDEEGEISETREPSAPASPSLGNRVTDLETEVEALRGVVRRLAQSLGEADPFPPDKGPHMAEQ
ncbi:MAG TPA: DUF480 domain-containing protein [Tepidisphaeraceae bacterium]|nr:DUF480 domain-containing protein [Tepidisphaeraceae bacterium]